jgi:hypothetical protein
MTINGIQWNLSKKNGDDTLWLLNIRKNPAIYKWSACYKEDHPTSSMVKGTWWRPHYWDDPPRIKNLGSTPPQWNNLADKTDKIPVDFG